MSFQIKAEKIHETTNGNNQMRNSTLLIMLMLVLTACGRDEMLDKAYFESLIDNPLDSDVQPLSAYHGKFKDKILIAKHMAEEMGIRFPPIFIRSGRGKDRHGGMCLPWETLGNRILIFEGAWREGDTNSSWVSMLVHEWGHCSLGIYKHEDHGIMLPASPGNAEDVLDGLALMNIEHNAGLDLTPFLISWQNENLNAPVKMPLSTYLKALPFLNNQPSNFLKSTDVYFDYKKPGSMSGSRQKIWEGVPDEVSIVDESILPSVQDCNAVRSSKKLTYLLKEFTEMQGQGVYGVRCEDNVASNVTQTVEFYDDGSNRLSENEFIKIGPVP